MTLVATLKELKSVMARKLPIGVKIMGDEDAPAWAPETQRIAPKTPAARQFNPFDKLVVGARDKQNNYVLLFIVGAKKNSQCTQYFTPGATYRISSYKVRDEQERFYSPPLAFSIDCSQALFEQVDLGSFPAWKPKDNIASLLARKTERRIDLAGKVLKVDTYNKEKKRRNVTLVDSSGHTVELMLFDKIGTKADNISVGDVVCFTDML